MDSGANFHVTPHVEQLDQATSVGKPTHLYTCTGEKTSISGVGFVSLPTNSDSQLHLNDVLIVPSATKNLLSVNKLTADNNVNKHFSNDDCVVKDKSTGHLLVRGRVNNQGMYPLRCKKAADVRLVTTIHRNQVPQVHTAAVLSSAQSKSKLLTKDEFLTWHYKLGHPSDRILKQILHSCNFRFPIFKHVCEACQYGKSKKLPFAHSVSHASSPFALVHTDLWGPSPLQSPQGHRYYIHFVDDYSRYTWLFPLKHKGESVNAFNLFKAQVENIFNTKIKAIQCDNGTEYKSIASIAQAAGIEMRYTCPYTSVQNGRAERKHRHIVELGLTLLAQARLPLTYWVDAFQMAVFLINRLPTPVLNNDIPLCLLDHTSR